MSGGGGLRDVVTGVTVLGPSGLEPGCPFPRHSREMVVQPRTPAGAAPDTTQVLVVDVPLPRRDVAGDDPLKVRFSRAEGRPFNPDRPSEFSTRYTPVCGTAEQFPERYMMSAVVNHRAIETMISVTMYNEEPSDLERTLKGICRNLDTFVARKGKQAWRQIQVVIVSDGRRQCNPCTLEYLEELGVFNRQLMNDVLDIANDVTMHLFETTVILSDGFTKSHCPMQLAFALKEHNGGKLDSHRWFFNAIAAQARPKYTFMVDVGTKPDPDAIWMLYTVMEEDQNVGGCCGQIDTIGTVHANPYVSAQHFEYLISTILDKSMESVFGFISVLPGAFSAYRYEAIEGAPLSKYFKLLAADATDLGPFQGNLYLAEDRILCFEVLARKGRAWTLRFVKGAKATTDVPDKLTSLIKQRRRWLNGSLFATVGVIANLTKFLNESSHNWFRKMAISILFAFYAGSTVLSWFLLANFYLMYTFAGDRSSEFYTILASMFWLMTIVQLVLGLGNKPDQMEKVYFLCSAGYGIFFFVTLTLTLTYLFSSQSNLYSTIAAVGTVSVYLVSSLLHGALFPVLGSFIQYFFLLPTFMISFPIYSFCNIHDVSWGTKGLDQTQERVVKATNRMEREMAETKMKIRDDAMRQTETRFRIFRSYLVIAWVGSNVAFVGFVSSFALQTTSYFDITFLIFSFFNAFRFVFSCIYIFQHLIRKLRSKCRRCPRKD